MFFPEGHIRVWLYGEPVDMRKSFAGLYVLARHGLKQDPLDGPVVRLRQPACHADQGLDVTAATGSTLHSVV